MTRTKTFTIGQIDYANSWPLFDGLGDQLDHTGFKKIPRVPAELNHMLANGSLDVSGISSFAYAQHADQLVLFPRLSVGSIGKVNSILLFLKEPLDKKLPEKISLSSTSATSVNLLKVMMELYWQCKPEYDTSSATLSEMLQDADGALLIGDPAIAESSKNSHLHIVDLGEAWHQWTGLGMTYAVIAARKDAFAENVQLLQRLHTELLWNKDANLQNIHLITNKACLELGGTEAYWNNYFSCLNYHFGTELQDGLKLYYKYAKQIGLLEREIDLNFI